MHTVLQNSFSRRAMLIVFSIVVAAISTLTLAFIASAAPVGGVGVGVSPNFPSNLNVGQTGVSVSMDITNTSGTTTPITLDNIFLTPSCGDFNIPCGTADPGVFAASGTGTGAGSCTGTNFTIAVVDAGTGKLQFTPSGTVMLSQTQTCTIDFTVDVLKAPAHDADGGLAGTQTAQIGQVTAHANALPGSGSGTNETTIAKANPSIATTLSTTTATIGTQVHDSAILSSSTASAGGTVTYTSFTNNTCSAGATSAGTKTVTNHIVPDSDPITYSVPGTFFWQAVYSGDANNNPATSTCTEEQVTIVAHPSTHLTKSANAATYHIGDTITYTFHEQNDGDVTLTNPSVTDNMCSPVTSVTSGGFNTGDTNSNNKLDPGETWNFTCQKVASTTGTIVNTATGHGFFNGLDVSYDPQYCAIEAVGEGIFCDRDEVASTSVTVLKNAPTIATTLSTTATTTGTFVHDSATLSGATATAGGSATYSVFTDNQCTQGKIDAGTKTVANGIVPDSNAIQFNNAGTFYWQVVYSGDAANSAATSTCGSEIVTITQPSGQYCSPGYWKQPQHFDSWKTYTPTQTFSSVFGRTITISWHDKGKPGPVTDPTLLQALQANGGGINLIAREAVDALENSQTLQFGFSAAQVIAAVQQAIDTNNPSLLDKFNLAENCPLN